MTNSLSSLYLERKESKNYKENSWLPWGENCIGLVPSLTQMHEVALMRMFASKQMSQVRHYKYYIDHWWILVASMNKIYVTYSQHNRMTSNSCCCLSDTNTASYCLKSMLFTSIYLLFLCSFSQKCNLNDINESWPMLLCAYSSWYLKKVWWFCQLHRSGRRFSFSSFYKYFIQFPRDSKLSIFYL